jgi:SPP1 family predicted phage head-tail adaptor
MGNSDTIGRMRHRIEIIQLIQGIDSDFGGETLTTSSTLATVWASWEAKEVGSGEIVNAGQKDLVQSVVFKIRYRSDVKTDMLIKYENVYYDILSLLPDSHRTYLTIEARQRGEAWNQTVT